MGKSEGTTRSSNNSKWGTFTTMFKQNRTLWLAGLLAFFVPSMAASAWYAGNTLGGTQTGAASNADFMVNAEADEASASSTAGDTSAGATAAANGTTSSSTAGTASPGVHTEVTVNGQKVPISNSSNNQTASTIESGGNTSHVSISVKSDQANSSTSSGFSSTHVHSNSSTNSNSNNLNSNTFHNSHTYTSP